MRILSKTSLLFLLLICTSGFSLIAQGVDELMDVLDTKAMHYEDLADRISGLPDHLLSSSNELDTKGEELKELSNDLRGTLVMADKFHGELENELDSFRDGCEALMEANCLEQEKRFNKFFWKIEPLLELGQEVVQTLDQIDNRYDEEFLLESFEESEKLALKLASKLTDLKEELISLTEPCG